MSPDAVPRYCPHRQLPPYSYVTGLFPHPTRDEQGHSFGQHETNVPALAEDTYRENAVYLFAIDLFNHGFYWEAHEAWESLWHAEGRHGPVADFLKGLIKLAAAGVKAREGRAAGVRQHAQRAVELFEGSRAAAGSSGDAWYGFELAKLIREANAIGDQAQELAEDGKPDGDRRLPVVLRLIAA